MLKANGRVIANSYTKENSENKVKRFDELIKKFKGCKDFEFFKATSSYVEIPPHTLADEASTYIIREYEGIQIITMGNTVYYIDTPQFRNLLLGNPEWNQLGLTEYRVIPAEACFCYLNDYGKLVHSKLLNEWNELVKPYMNYRGY